MTDDKFVEIEATTHGYIVWQRKPVEHQLLTTRELHLAQWVEKQLNAQMQQIADLEAERDDLARRLKTLRGAFDTHQDKCRLRIHALEVENARRREAISHVLADVGDATLTPPERLTVIRQHVLYALDDDESEDA